MPVANSKSCARSSRDSSRRPVELSLRERHRFHQCEPLPKVAQRHVRHLAEVLTDATGAALSRRGRCGGPRFESGDVAPPPATSFVGAWSCPELLAAPASFDGSPQRPIRNIQSFKFGSTSGRSRMISATLFRMPRYFISNPRLYNFAAASSWLIFAPSGGMLRWCRSGAKRDGHDADSALRRRRSNAQHTKHRPQLATKVAIDAQAKWQV